MKNDFLKFVPFVLIVIAIALLFVPKKISYLDAEKFFAATDAYYQRADKGFFTRSEGRREDYYYPGVHIGKLWKKMGLARTLAGKRAEYAALRDEYLFGCGLAEYTSCVLPYPVVKEYQLGDYRVMRVSSASVRFPDYQYLLFRDLKGAWAYFGHIDVFDNKAGEPMFQLLDNGLCSVVSLAGMGDGYSTKFIQVYRLDGTAPKLLTAVVSEASRKGLGLLDFEVTSAFEHSRQGLTGNYRITFMAERRGDGRPGDGQALFTVTRRVTFTLEGRELVYDAARSSITPTDLARITSGSYARVYAMFRDEFDKLSKADAFRKAWFAEFMTIVQEEGVPVSGPLPGSR
jgi:hypothetical protein